MKPTQGIATSFCVRAPGLDENVVPGEMAYEFPEGPFGKNAKGYEGPLRDAMLGNPMLFPSAAFIEQGWKLVQPLLDAWSPQNSSGLAKYPAGSEGPREADAGAQCGGCDEGIGPGGREADVPGDRPL